MCKKIISIFISMFLSVSLFAYSGAMKDSTNLKSLKTRYFEIIYGQECRAAAIELYENADAICEDLCRQLGYEPYMHFPVTLVSSTDSFNAYYTNTSFNHIVLYCTAPDEDLVVFSDNLLSIFRHELGHAISLNINSNFVKAMQKVFGPAFNWGDYVAMPQMMKEGAAVALESAGGEGRINDPYFLHMARQAKLSKVFPDSEDVAGSRDIFPSGSASYGFGALFAQYLIDTYGMERYAHLWYKAANFGGLTWKRVFKKAYGKPLDKVWTEFMYKFNVPKIDVNPLRGKGVYDFYDAVNYFKFGSGLNKYSYTKKTVSSTKNSEGHLYSNLASCEKGFAWYENYSRNIYFSSVSPNTDAVSNKNVKISAPKKILHVRNVRNLSFSQDGKLLAVTHYALNDINVKSSVFIYDTEANKRYNFKIKSVANAAVTYKDGKYYLVTLETFAQDYNLHVYEFNFSNNLILANEIHFNPSENVFSLCGGKNGELSLIHVEKLKWKILEYNNIVSSDSYNEYIIGEGNERLRYLSPVYSNNGKKEYSFTWATKETFPRYGKIEINENKASCYLDSKDLSGGVYYPVTFGNIIVYAGHFYNHKKLFLRDSDFAFFNIENSSNEVAVNFVKGKKDLTAEKESSVEGNLFAAENPPLEIIEASKQYPENDYKALFGPRPGFAPLATVIDFTKDNSDQNTSGAGYQELLAGGTLIFTNPWDSFELLISAGTNYLDSLVTEALSSEKMDVRTGFAVEVLSGYTDTSLFTYDIKNNLIFNETFAFSEFNNVVSVASDIPLSDYFYLGLNDSNIFIFNDFQNDSYNFNLQNAFDVELQMLTRTGSSVYEKAGFVFGLGFTNEFNWLTSNSDPSQNAYEYELNIYPYITAYIPKLIPLSNEIGKVKGFPSYFTFSLQPNKQTLYNGEFNILWYANEIQNGAHYMPLYFNKIEISSFFIFGREFYLENTNNLFQVYDNIFNQRSIGPTYSYKSIGIDLCLKASYNSGSLAGNSMLALKLSVGLYFDEFHDEAKPFYDFGFSSTF